MYRQVTDPLGHPALTALLAALPLLVLLFLLGVVRTKSHTAALGGLATAALVAIACYRMPVLQVADGAAEGAAFGLFPIVWIVLNAVWINKLQRASGHFDTIGKVFSSLSDDTRVQALLIAYCFGAMIESLSGFGTPIAITSLLLLALGLEPLKAAAVATFANTAPAAFGSVGNPIQALAKVTSYSTHDLGAMVGRQSPVVAFLVPFALLLMLDGRRGLREVWPAAAVAGAGFGAGQFLCANYLVYQLTDVGAAVASTVALVLLLRVWTPRRRTAAEGEGGGGVSASAVPTATVNALGGPAVAAGAPLVPAPAPAPAAEAVAGTVTGPAWRPDGRSEAVRAFSPYAILTVLFALVSLHGPVERFVRSFDTRFAWPGLHVAGASGRPVSIADFDFGWLGAAGTLLLTTGVLTSWLLRVPLRQAVRCYGQALRQLRPAALTIACVLALSYVMNLSGMAVSLGTWLAGIGSAFALLSGFLGWFGVALTGSDTSSNALFGAMQVSAARHSGLSPLLMAATNSSAGVLGKAAAMQNLVIAAGALGLSGREGEILRKVIGWSLGLLVVLCLVALLQSTPVLDWMVPGG
ncbi:L-lactate permease [Streptomyces sp. UNOC14_S4]|uniref:L-lactate permease n=1 Tax=Streptomyces sp. UNOC14_S4 TaxID=2872340 RepID=UPI001E4D6B54|nr:L-lactate permease [Streptomyces sp. UNOC14_S4]MCC3766156.1 L-lactate permease [Streptomyces sp. UNOC14_S4]